MQVIVCASIVFLMIATATTHAAAPKKPAAPPPPSQKPAHAPAPAPKPAAVKPAAPAAKPTAPKPPAPKPPDPKPPAPKAPAAKPSTTAKPAASPPPKPKTPEKKPAPLRDGAHVVSATFPHTLTTGERSEIDITLRNTGNTTWTRASYQLGDVAADDPFTSLKRVACANDARVAPAETCRVRMTFTAPSRPGTYASNWRMIHDRTGWFGDTIARTIIVQGVDQATMTAQAKPVEVRPGNKTTVTIQARNTGTTTWTAGRYRLWYFRDGGRFNPAAATLTVSNNVPPGGSYRFAVSLTAPDELDSKTIEWQMVNAAGRPFGHKLAQTIRLSVPLLWQQAGVFVAWDTATIHPSAYNGILNFADVLRKAGVRWIALQVHNGLDITSWAADAGGAAWVKAWHDAGFLVGGWGFEQTQPEPEAALAASLVKNWALDFYIANAELTYKCDQGDDACGRSARFVAAMAQALKDNSVSVPLALSTYGRADLKVEPWRDGGYELLPQAYWNAYLEYEPSASADFWNGAGWPRTRIHPTIGMGRWDEGRRMYVPVAQYMADLALARTLGFSVYLVETMPEDEWPNIGAGVAAGRAKP
jgi:Ig-like domain-containing protein